MKHLVLLFFVISFTSGVVAIILGSMFYLKNKHDPIKQLIIANCYFCGLLFLDIINYYVGINYIKTQEIFYMIILLGLLLTGIGLIYHFTLFVHLLLSLEFSKKKRFIFYFTAITAVLLLIGLNIAYANNILYKYFQYPTSFLLHNLFTGVGAYYNLFLLVMYRKSVHKEVKKFLMIGIVFIAIVVPLSIFMNSLEYSIRFPYPMPFSPIIFFLINILGIAFARKTLLHGLDKHPKENYDIVLKKYLSQFDITERELEIVKFVLEGFGNQDIGDKLFISPNTVKNHIYNIYRKMGIKNRYELMSNIAKINE
ncbi:MAG: hypothetical protein CVU84_11160 [Firmicutes bacterium HGW-Firmicutes-1]|jgi:DNA-binding CsgD family transcriptional regulator|nr:MAG: hypothetical protein CVU84_11160 [Firmicutes bacterium HGW-Firmicutes-1]